MIELRAGAVHGHHYTSEKGHILVMCSDKEVKVRFRHQNLGDLGPIIFSNETTIAQVWLSGILIESLFDNQYTDTVICAWELSFTKE